MDDICQVRGTVINQHWNRLQICAAGQTGPNTPIFIPFRPMLRKKMYQHWKQNTETMPNCESFYCSYWLKLNEWHESWIISTHNFFLNIYVVIYLNSLLMLWCDVISKSLCPSHLLSSLTCGDMLTWPQHNGTINEDYCLSIKSTNKTIHCQTNTRDMWCMCAVLWIWFPFSDIGKADQNTKINLTQF